MTYTGWTGSQPDGGTYENCIYQYNNYWGDYRCSSSQYSMCQVKVKGIDSKMMSNIMTVIIRNVMEERVRDHVVRMQNLVDCGAETVTKTAIVWYENISRNI